jgi:hypothetical protein
MVCKNSGLMWVAAAEKIFTWMLFPAVAHIFKAINADILNIFT